MKLTKLLKAAATNRNGRNGIIAAMMASLMVAPASAAGLEKAKTMFETLQTELTTIVPIFAAIVLLVLGVAYAGNFIRKETFINWVVGIIISGSAVQVTAMLFT
ncbi:TPA: TrbC/VirB2 family protein [Vibrio parahaemolyticus]|nr:TrbC/VirB2 family protein [Vibrio parahaemolyticus]